MGQAISEVLPFAIGVAISPLPIIAVILVLFSARAKVNGPAFLAGWLVGVAAVSIVAYVVADAGDASDSTSSTSDSVYWIKLGLGVLLVVLAVKNWRADHAATEPPPQPRWMASIDSLPPVKAAGLALVLSAVNPKQPRPLAGRRRRAGATGSVGGRGRGRADRVHRRGERQHRRARDLLPGRRPARHGGPRQLEVLALGPQRGGDGRAVPGLRRRALQRGPARPQRLRGINRSSGGREVQPAVVRTAVNRSPGRPASSHTPSGPPLVTRADEAGRRAVEAAARAAAG